MLSAFDSPVRMLKPFAPDATSGSVSTAANAMSNVALFKTHPQTITRSAYLQTGAALESSGTGPPPLLRNQLVVAPHPVRQQEVAPVILAASAVAAVEVVGIAVPLRHRQLVIGQHDQRLTALEV